MDILALLTEHRIGQQAKTISCPCGHSGDISNDPLQLDQEILALLLREALRHDLLKILRHMHKRGDDILSLRREIHLHNSAVFTRVFPLHQATLLKTSHNTCNGWRVKSSSLTDGSYR